MTPGMLSLYAWPDGTECKALHCGERVGEAKRGRTQNEERTAVHGGRPRDAK